MIQIKNNKPLFFFYYTSIHINRPRPTICIYLLFSCKFVFHQMLLSYVNVLLYRCYGFLSAGLIVPSNAEAQAIGKFSLVHCYSFFRYLVLESKL